MLIKQAWLSSIIISRSFSCTSPVQTACRCAAAVCSLLHVTSHMRAGAECWAFSPPGGLCSPNLASMTASFCHSFVLGKDMVPRASAKSLNALLDALILTLGRSRLSTLRCGCQVLSEASCSCQVSILACPRSSGPSNAIQFRVKIGSELYRRAASVHEMLSQVLAELETLSSSAMLRPQ